VTTAEQGLQHGTGFDRRNVLLLSGAHLAHDVYPAFLGVLLPLLIEELDLSLAVAGVLASTIRWTTSLQPVLGHWADRTDTRYWVIFTPALTASCMSLLGVAPNTAAVVALLLLAGLSHAAFHPAGGALATRASGTEWGRGTSYFMTGGEIGRVLGPLLIAGVVGTFGLRASPAAVIPGLLGTVVLWFRFGSADALALRPKPPAKILEALRAGRASLLLLSGAMVFRSFANVAIVIYYPTYATREGASLFVAAAALAVYEVGAVAGTLTGGILSDRHGRTRVMLLGLLAALPPLFGAVLVGPTWLGLALLMVAGFLWLSASGVELALMQQLLPGNRSTAVGLTYFARSAGAIVAMMAIGVVGDELGLRVALLGAIGVGAVAIVFMALLREPAAVTPETVG
jgi:MFS transporter, FSR family, fosmidomycin resistance protein